MAKLRRISGRNQLTLPPSILRDAGVSPGGYVSVTAKDGKIILEPKSIDDRPLALDDAQWRQLDRLVKRQIRTREYTEYSNPEAAKKHLRSIRK